MTYLLRNPETTSQKSKLELEKMIQDFPYFQPARALYLKILKAENNYLYNSELKKTAAYTTDRSVLFDYITTASFVTETIHETIEETIEEKVTVNDDILENDAKEMEMVQAILDPNLFERKTQKREQEKAVEDILEVHKPLPFSKNDKHSFSEWLKLASAKPIQREEEKVEIDSEKEEKFRLIDKFIQDNPKIKPMESNPSIESIVPSSKPNEHLMTETLAKVYLQQKNYKKAIQAYKILILKNPEKSGFFADQIRAIEKLQQNN